jgi:hypothetical protein
MRERHDRAGIVLLQRDCPLIHFRGVFEASIELIDSGEPDRGSVLVGARIACAFLEVGYERAEIAVAVAVKLGKSLEWERRSWLSDYDLGVSIQKYCGSRSFC